MREGTTTPSQPVTVWAHTMELSTASSVHSAMARKGRSILSSRNRPFRDAQRLCPGVIRVGGGEAHEYLPGAVAGEGSHPGQPHAPPAEHPAQLAAVQGQVGGHDQDAGTHVRGVLCVELFSQGRADVPTATVDRTGCQVGQGAHPE